MEPEDLLVARLKRIDADQLAKFMTYRRKGMTDEEFLLETGWTLSEACEELLKHIQRLLGDLND